MDAMETLLDRVIFKADTPALKTVRWFLFGKNLKGKELIIALLMMKGD